MMTLYFSRLQECTELLIDILVWRHFSKVSFRDGHDKLALTLDLFFIAFSRYFCTLIFPQSLSSCRFLHTSSLQLVCDDVPFTLLNITDHSVVIDKLQQDKSGQALLYLGSVSADSEAPDIMFICSMVDFCIHTYIEAVRYIFISKICFCVLMVQIADLCCEVKIKNDIFVFLFGMFSKVMFL